MMLQDCVCLFHHSRSPFEVVGPTLLQNVSTGIRPSSGRPDNTRDLTLHMLVESFCFSL